MSCASCSTNVQVHVARVSSCTSATFPNSRRAARRASSPARPSRLALAGLLFQVEPEFLLKLGFLDRTPH